LNPDFARAYFFMGFVYLGLNKKGDAHASLIKAKKLGFHVPQDVFNMCK
jgi:hypothetical protein